MNTEATDKLTNALAMVGKNACTRGEILKILKHAEQKIKRRDFNVRNEVTGPIVDALYSDAGLQVKTLSQGLRFFFYYQGNIHRELVMSSEECPDHVWEPQTTKLLLLLAQSAKNVIIGGAYSGDQALLIAQSLSSGEQLVYCFEPNKKEREQLKFNMVENGLHNLHIDERGLWSSENVHLSLSSAGDQSHSGSVLAGENSEQAFCATSITSFCAEKSIEDVDLIMLDIEGGELDALQGAEQFLKMESGRAPNLIFEVHRSYVDWSNGLHKIEIVDYIERFGYKVFAIRDFQGNWPMTNQPIELVLPETAYLEGPTHGFNMIAVKDPTILTGPNFRIRQGVSPKYLRHRDPALHGLGEV